MDRSGTSWRRWMLDLVDLFLLGACCWLIWNSIEHPGPVGHSVIFVAIYAALAIVFAARLLRHHLRPRPPGR